MQACLHIRTWFGICSSKYIYVFRNQGIYIYIHADVYPYPKDRGSVPLWLRIHDNFLNNPWTEVPEVRSCCDVSDRHICS